MLFACEAVCFVTLLPISPLHLGIGFLWGPIYGALLAETAYAIGCVPPFLLVRIPCLRERFTMLRRRAELLDGVFAAVEQEPFKLIVCLRLSPVLHTALNSYLLGLTTVPLRVYLPATIVGSFPNVSAWVYVGSLLESLADIAAGRVQRTPVQWMLGLAGLAATVGLLVYVSRAATKRIHAANARKVAASELDTELSTPSKTKADPV